MYSDMKKNRLPVLLAVLLLVIILGVFSILAIQRSRRDMRNESVTAIKHAVEQTALQCYAVEGVFPESIEYLEDNYGLQVNRENYYIVYEAFASNMLPDVKVVPKN